MAFLVKYAPLYLLLHITAQFIMRLSFALVASLLFALTGCAVHDVDENKPLAVPEDYYNRYQPTGKTTSKQLSWQEIFTNPQLHTLLNQANKNNYQLREVWLRVQKARQAVSLARSARLPTGTLSLNAQNTDSQTNNTSTNTTAINLVGGIAWEVDLWQRLHSKQKARAWLAQASIYEAGALSLSISGQIIDTWLDIRYATTEQALIKTHLLYQQQLYRTLLAEAQQGSIDGFVLLQQKNAVLGLQQEMVANKKRIAELKNALSLYTGMSQAQLPKQWQPITDSEITTTPLVDPNTLTPSMLLDSRLDVQQTFARLQAADYDIAAALADYWPSVNLSLQTTLSGDTLSSVGDNIKTVGIASITTQLFSLPSLRTKEAQARTDFARAYAQLQHTVRTALKEVEDALIAVDLIARRLRLARLQQQTARELKNQAELKYQAGALTYQELLTYEASYFRHTVTIGTLISNLLKARKNLVLAAGMVRKPTPQIHNQQPQ